MELVSPTSFVSINHPFAKIYQYLFSATIDLRNKVSEELTFISDQFYCGRGFFGVFEQFPCEIPTPLTPSPNPPPACNRIIKDDMFTIEVFDHHSETCTFTIQKSSEV